MLAIDIAGAFDNVSHPGVLHKAKRSGIRGPLLTWLRSYLENRQFKAVVGGQLSIPHDIRSGVDQGSILGPTLFLLYVNDCQDILPPGIGLVTYADVTTLCQSISTSTDIPDASEALQQATDAIFHWGSTWRIAFEPTKSQALQIDHNRPPSSLPVIPFNVFDVPEADQVKLLGVVFDRHLRFTAHIRSTAPNVYPVALFTWLSHSLQGLCPPNIRVQPPDLDGCICDHSGYPGHCATPCTQYHWPQYC